MGLGHSSNQDCRTTRSEGLSRNEAIGKMQRLSGAAPVAKRFTRTKPSARCNDYPALIDVHPRFSERSHFAIIPIMRDDSRRETLSRNEAIGKI